VDVLSPVLHDLLDQAKGSLQDANRLPGLVSLQPGNTVSWDNCCESGGTLWVRVVSLTPRPAGAQPCGVQAMHCRAAVGVVRCMHGLTEEGTPTAEQMTGDTDAMLADADALMWALCDWSSALADPGPVARKTVSFEGGLPLGPTGFCGGFEWTLSFQYAPRRA
jgi:hypothetical protein